MIIYKRSISVNYDLPTFVVQINCIRSNYFWRIDCRKKYVGVSTRHFLRICFTSFSWDFFNQFNVTHDL